MAVLLHCLKLNCACHGFNGLSWQSPRSVAVCQPAKLPSVPSAGQALGVQAARPATPRRERPATSRQSEQQRDQQHISKSKSRAAASSAAPSPKSLAKALCTASPRSTNTITQQELDMPLAACVPQCSLVLVQLGQACNQISSLLCQ